MSGDRTPAVPSASGEASKVDYKITKLTNSNYAVWKWQFVNVLRAKNLVDLLDIDDGASQRSFQALALLGSSLDDENSMKIINCNSFKAAFESLQRCHENKSTYEKQALFQRLNSFKISSPATVSSKIGELQGIVAQLRNLNESVSDANLMGAILSSLPPQFDVFKQVWRNSSAADQNSENLITRVISEAAEIAGREASTSESKALLTRNNKNNGNKKGSKQKAKYDSDTCAYCKEKGHWVKDCSKAKKTAKWQEIQKKKQEDGKDPKPKDPKDDKSELAFVTGSIKNDYKDRSIWIVDSGCTTHMTPHFDLLSDYQEFDTPKHIELSEEEPTVLLGLGSGTVLTKQGKLNKVWFVPSLGQNLFSIEQEVASQLRYAGDSKGLTFFKEDEAVLHAQRIDKLLLLCLEPTSCTSSNRALLATEKEWHLRLGHVNFATMNKMKKTACVEGLEIVKIDNKTTMTACIDCAANKCTRTSHSSKSTAKQTKPGVSLHGDTAGKFSVPCLGGALYYLLVKDEASGYCMVEFTDCKANIKHLLMKIVAKSELETGNRVLKLNSDNGSEFINFEMEQFISERGILHTKYVVETPEQNGYIEREIRTVTESARTMLDSFELETKLWGEAVNTAVYVRNRTLHGNQTKTPYELWFNKKPDISNLRVFGQQAIVRKKKNQISGKFDEKGIVSIFVGYTDVFNTYRFLQDNKIVVSCNAVFLSLTRETLDKLAPLSGQDETIVTDVVSQSNTETSVSNSTSRNSSISSFGQANNSFATCDGQSSNTTSQTIILPAEELRESSSSGSQLSSTAATGESVLISFDQTEPTRSDNSQVESANNLINVRGHNYWNRRGPDGKYLPKPTAKLTREVARALLSKQTMNRIIVDEPRDFLEAVWGEESEEWARAMDEEMSSLKDNDVFEVVDLPLNTNIVTCKWVYKVKYNQDGSVNKYKARLVARGFTQELGTDYNETFAPVSNPTTVRLLLAHAAVKSYKLAMFDVKTAFLYGLLDETIYMDEPQGYETWGPPKVWRLKKSIYGLKQSPRNWYKTADAFIREQGLIQSVEDPCLYFNLEPFMAITLYVDDGLIVAEQQDSIDDFLKRLELRFKIHSPDVSRYLGFEIEFINNGILLHQTNYISKVLKDFEMHESRSVECPVLPNWDKTRNDEEKADKDDYQQLCGALMYAAHTVRLDIAFASNILSRRQHSPAVIDEQLSKRVLRYLNGSKSVGIFYSKADNLGLIGYADADFAGSSDFKSTSGFVVMYGGGPVMWGTYKQPIVTTSTTEAEYVSLCNAAKKLVWLRNLALELKMIDTTPTRLLSDNKSALAIAENEKYSPRTRHIGAQWAYTREQVKNETLKLEHVKGVEQKADFFTKPLSSTKFTINRNWLMVSLLLVLLVSADINCEKRRYELLLDMENPCSVLPEAKEWSTFEQNNNFRNNFIQLCDRHYQNRIKPALVEVHECLDSGNRLKRDIISTIADVVGAGVNNLITSNFMRADKYDIEFVQREMIKQARYAAHDLLAANKGLKDEIVKELRIASKSVENHLAIAEQVANDTPIMLFAISLIESESLAAKANLKAIAKACRAGKVATLEMAEMLGMPELEQINSEKTSMIAIRSDEKSESVRFIFSADVDSDMIEFMLVIVWAAATLTAAFLSLTK